MNEDELIAKWMEIRRKDLLQTWILMVILDVIILFGLFLMPGSLEGESITNIIFGIVCMAVIIFVTILRIKAWIKSFSWQMNDKGYGIVVEKKRHTNKRVSQGKRARGYYVMVNRDGKIIEAKCEASMYRKMEIQDEVLLIQVEKYQIHALK